MNEKYFINDMCELSGISKAFLEIFYKESFEAHKNCKEIDKIAKRMVKNKDILRSVR